MKKNIFLILLIVMSITAFWLTGICSTLSNTSQNEAITSFIDTQKSDLDASIGIATSNKSVLPQQMNSLIPLPSARTIATIKKIQHFNNEIVIVKRFSTNIQPFFNYCSAVIYSFESPSDFFVFMLRHLII